MTRKWFLLLASISLVMACRFSAPLFNEQTSPNSNHGLTNELSEPSADVSTISPTTTVRYSDLPAADPELLSLDIYAKRQSNSPVVIYVHGGGWSGGDKLHAYRKPAAFNARGFVFVSVNYRLYPEVTIEDEAGDVARAIVWVKNNIASYGGDPSQIWLMGWSAGAHLASLVGTDEKFIQMAGANLSLLRGVIALDSPIYDLPKLLATTEGGGELRSQLEIAFGTSEESWKNLSPAWHIESGKEIPPFLVIHTGTQLARGDLAREFHSKLLAVGVNAQIFPALDKNHTDVNHEIGFKGDFVSQALFDFIALTMQAAQ